jgi:hypothetical protein
MDRWYNVQVEPFVNLPELKIKQANKRARKVKGTQKNKIQSYLTDSKTYTKDTQNVHDSSVNTDARDTYKMIQREKHKNTQQDTMIDIIVAANQHTKWDKIVPVISRMGEGLEIISLKDGEDRILENVWNRSYHPKNNGPIMREAILDQLANCWENDRMVCGSGRTMKVLASLATIDTNPTAGTSMTREAYRNEAFNLASKSLNDTIDKYSTGSANERLYSRSFVELDIEDSKISDKVRERFKNIVMKPIKEYMVKNKSKLSTGLEDEILIGLSL